MRKAITLFFICFFSQIGAHDFEKNKKKIFELQDQLMLALSSDQKSELYFQLAQCYFNDQEEDKAFEHFLEALALCSVTKHSCLEPLEEEIYCQALATYMAQEAEPVKVAEKILCEYGDIARTNPTFYHLNFLIASAYANLGQYGAFFEKFYQGYPYLYDTFLAYKTQGMLLMRLSLHQHDQEKKAHFKARAERYFLSALEKNPKDAGLYRVFIHLAKDAKNGENVRFYLQEMVKHQAVIARGDVFRYVTYSVELADYDLAQTIIDRARSDYVSSQAIIAAQKYLNQNKG